MSRDCESDGCGCLGLILIAIILGGGVWQGAAILAAGWLLYLILVGVSLGIVAWIVKAIAGD